MGLPTMMVLPKGLTELTLAVWPAETAGLSGELTERIGLLKLRYLLRPASIGLKILLAELGRPELGRPELGRPELGRRCKR